MSCFRAEQVGDLPDNERQMVIHARSQPSRGRSGAGPASSYLTDVAVTVAEARSAVLWPLDQQLGVRRVLGVPRSSLVPEPFPLHHHPGVISRIANAGARVDPWLVLGEDGVNGRVVAKCG